MITKKKHNTVVTYLKLFQWHNTALIKGICVSQCSSARKIMYKQAYINKNQKAPL